ncbi:hypothetical protein GWK16_15120 [Roseomonas sp. JC162]|uniref:Uncharacterized protein n=1 Tax=Neoroseomonas marina TaxID=1232220 RepID=A0A848EF10_9PROT|nr:hypothetical protein [Neoroseomonas marina]NMJ42576.1 hypothetical protein [Neoroseomonas marina]
MTQRVSRPAVTVHALAHAEAALTAAGPAGVALISAPGAAGFLGPAWFLALAAEAGRRHPGAAWDAVLDCADAAGTALAAIRAGARCLVLAADATGFAAVAGAAAEAGVVLLPSRPPSLDLARLDLRRRAGAARLAAWLAMEAPQGSPTPRAP